MTVGALFGYCKRKLIKPHPPTDEQGLEGLLRTCKKMNYSENSKVLKVKYSKKNCSFSFTSKYFYRCLGVILSEDRCLSSILEVKSLRLKMEN